MMPLEYVVVVANEKSVAGMSTGGLGHPLANPRKGTQDGDDNEDVCDYPGRDDGPVLDGVVP